MLSTWSRYAEAFWLHVAMCQAETWRAAWVPHQLLGRLEAMASLHVQDLAKSWKLELDLAPCGEIPGCIKSVRLLAMWLDNVSATPSQVLRMEPWLASSCGTLRLPVIG